MEHKRIQEDLEQKLSRLSEKATLAEKLAEGRRLEMMAAIGQLERLEKVEDRLRLIIREETKRTYEEAKPKGFLR